MERKWKLSKAKKMAEGSRGQISVGRLNVQLRGRARARAFSGTPVRVATVHSNIASAQLRWMIFKDVKRALIYCSDGAQNGVGRASGLARASKLS